MLTKSAEEFAGQTKVPVTLTNKEVKNVCKELGLTDWTRFKSEDDVEITKEEAQILLDYIVAKEDRSKIPLEGFRRGLEVELEHGAIAEGINLTNNHPIQTSLIALAHLKESAKYYTLLDKMESQF
jgi:hypothetical protein